jgi:hypothetical protein
MKRKKLLLAMLLSMLAFDLSAYDFEMDGIYYNYKNGSSGSSVSVTYKRVDYYDYGGSYYISDYTGNVIIPESVTYNGKSYSVTSIDEYAFEDCTGLTSVTIPNSVTSIGNDAFEGCTGLTSVTIPNSVSFIGSFAFYECNSLTTITIPNSVTYIDYGAFEGCKNISQVIVPVTDFGDFCSNSIIGLIRSNIGAPVMLIDNNGNEITEYIIPEGVTSIGNSAFRNCTGLTSVTIPSSVTSIGDYAFQGCTSLTSITIPRSVTSIGDYALSGCTGLTSVALFCECVDTWFSGYKSITEVTCGEGVKTIKDNAFNGCTALQTINIGSTVDSIGSRAFAGSDKLTDVTCKAVSIPETAKTAFENSYPEYADLHVPSVSVSAYQETAPWNKFNHIIAITSEVPDDAEQCATPTITYSKGMLSFRCTTEGAECISSIEDSDIGTYSIGDVQLTVTYTVSVYARKEGFKDSETATATLCWIDVQPQTEGVEVATNMQSIEAVPVLIQTNGQVVSITGAAEGTEIAIYDVAGKLVGSSKASVGTTDICTTLHDKDIAIVKIGSKSVKVVMK